jgi:hypothetical protein
VEITYSYWDGSGHRKTITVKKGNSVYQFLCKVENNIYYLIYALGNIELFKQSRRVLSKGEPCCVIRIRNFSPDPDQDPKKVVSPDPGIRNKFEIKLP